jgi:hypothetical protein
VDDARRAFRDALAYLGAGGGGRMVKTFARTWLTTVTGMSGLATDARREFDAIEWWAEDPQACMFDPYRSLAEAWVCAAEGAVSQAVSIMRAAAEKECELGRLAWEVVLLQTATQFGDASTAARLTDLAAVVQGPRAPAAAAHSAALATANADGLLDASRRYEDFGDLLAAADAAAQAAGTCQRTGHRGPAMTAGAIAARLATRCQSAQTPASPTVNAKSSPLQRKGFRTRRSPTGSSCRSAPSRDTSSARLSASARTRANS